ncbi:MAG TPA: universal stress protein [Bacteroidia bacterium]|nr:universal stress protein [Bacteroidia bacterium]
MSKDQNKILVPIDFSDQSLIALKQSYNLARLTKSEILLIYVLDEDFIKSLEHIFTDKSYEDPVRDQVQLRLDKLADEVHNEAGVKVNTTIRKGKIYEEIVNVAKEIDAKFIIMGTHGNIGLKKKFLGSNASRVIKEASCPVITIKGKKHHYGCKKIVLPLDLSRETKEKVDKAIELAGFFGSTIYIVSVIESDDEFLMNKLTRQMNQVKEIIESNNIPVHTEFVKSGDIPEEIINYAEKIDADLVIIMTQQEIYWTEMFIGFAAQEIINKSDIPVLSIRPQLRSIVEFTTS